MRREEVLARADERIRKHRSADVQLRLASKDGEALAGARVSVRLVRHEFKLGCNAFKVGRIEDRGLQKAYEERFAALLNYATLPFYWGGFEPEKDLTREEALDAMADWCRRHGITPKGHPLVWHEVFPRWAGALDDAEVLERLENRVRHIVYRYQGRVDIWDVVNEATVSHRFSNAVGRWMKKRGAAACVADALRWARSSNPEATLLYNDFNVSPAFERLVQALLEQKAPLDAIGIQSHMHKGTWPLTRVWNVCETYARFDLPIHFTEVTVLSGELKKDNDWHRRRDDWHTTREGEEAQLRYGKDFYTVLFSHPAVEAITWWDFSDLGSWQGAPAGLVRKDMSPKPLYNWLFEAFKKKWTTDFDGLADREGRVRLSCFFGDHEVVAVLPSGERLKGDFAVRRNGGRQITVRLGE